VQARVRFIEEWLADEYESWAALCAAHGVSRKTGYKWLARFKGGGTAGLADRPKRWKSHPQTTDTTMVEMIVGTRRRHPSWGPKKLHVWLERRGYEPPAVSTIGAILKREGCVKPRRRRERTQDYANGLAAQDAPNAVWAADFKGWFPLKSGMKCYPLTISDGFSRYLLRCEALQHPDELACKEVFDGLFREFGLPTVLRTDNGTPFSGRFGISALSVWWVKLGIRPERIQRGKPTQNGRHERIHRTLQEDIVKHGKVQQRMYHQQRVFDQFRHKYNTERPHEALNNQVPASLYVPSSKRYPCALRSPEYPADWEVYLVRRDGSIRVPGRDLFVSTVLVSEPVAFEPLPDGSMAVRYGPLKLGTLASNGRFVRGSRRSRRDLKAPSEELQAGSSDQELPRVAIE
jgi:transposase InsO family protein